MAVLAFGLSGCVSIEGDTDNSVDESVTYGNGDVLDCRDGNCTLAPEGTDPTDGDAVVGEYNAEYTQAECTAAGFFYCTIENVCMNTPAAGGTCGQ